MISCPRCGLSVTELHVPEGDLKMRVEATGEQLPGQICAGCISDLKKFVATSSGGVLMAQERAKEQHRICEVSVLDATGPKTAQRSSAFGVWEN